MTVNHVDHYLKIFEEIRKDSNLNGNSYLDEFRQKSWNNFAKTGIPAKRRGNERWKYTNLRPLLDLFHMPVNRDYKNIEAGFWQNNVPVVENAIVIPLINGIYCDYLSNNLLNDNDVILKTIQESIEDIEHFSKMSNSIIDPFIALNSAFMNDVINLKIKNNNYKKVIHIVNISAGDEVNKTINNPRVMISGEQDSEFSVIETFVALPHSLKPHFSNCVTEIILGKNAYMDHYRILLEQENSFHIGNTRVYQSEGSRFNSISYSRSPLIGSNEIEVFLQGSGSKCYLKGLYITLGTQHMVNHISVNHEKPNAESHQFFKGILSGKSRAIFSGKVLVERDAQKTIADQKDFNLLLSRGAEIDTKPSLEIYADDVKCSHGATAGHVDIDTLFYLMSRGLHKRTATEMLIKGFADEIINQIQLDQVKAFVQKDVEDLLPDLNFEE